MNSDDIRRIRVEPIVVPRTARLAAEAAVWASRGRRPPNIVEPGPEQESVWAYPRPPALQRVLEHVTVEAFGEVVADTTSALRVCETSSPPTYYIPLADIASDRLRDESGFSICEWKGTARYHSLVIDGRRAAHCAWSYPKPTDEYQALVDTIAFYPGRVDRCTIAGYDVVPQSGDFYAGWITPDLVGPFKGALGSDGW